MVIPTALKFYEFEEFQSMALSPHDQDTIGNGGCGEGWQAHSGAC